VALKEMVTRKLLKIQSLISKYFNFVKTVIFTVVTMKSTTFYVLTSYSPVGHVARIVEKRNAYRILVGKPEGKRPL
jgi:hypothetical protein